MSELILYTLEDGRSQFKLGAEQHMVWLTHLEIAELSADSVVKDSLTDQEMFV